MFSAWYKRVMWPNHFAMDHLSRKLKSVWRARYVYMGYRLRKYIHRIKVNRMEKNPDFHEAVSVMERAMTNEPSLVLIYKKYLPRMNVKGERGVFRRTG